MTRGGWYCRVSNAPARERRGVFFRHAPALALLLVALIANVIPATRAAVLDQLVALRQAERRAARLASVDPNDVQEPTALHAETRQTGTFQGVSPTDLQLPALTVLAHPDSRRVGEMVLLADLPGGESVDLSRQGPLFAQPGCTETTPLAVAHLSRRPLRLVPGPGVGEVSIERAGSRTQVDVDGEHLAERHVLGDAELRRGVVLTLGHRIVLLFHRHHPVHVPQPSLALIGESTPMVRLRGEVRLVAGLDTPILLRGESGTGKELLARAVHDTGERRGRPYLSVNMSAIPSSLATSELFGAARGAYTGSDRKKNGFFQHADGGTLFLDEISETPPDVQPLLLRVLDNGEVQPVGTAEPGRVDVRVLAATDADLETLIAEGRFRRPLLHRLAGYVIHVPPLRERKSDFGRLLYHFLDEELGKLGVDDAYGGGGRPWPPADVVARLVRHDWPGNVRELRNVARRMAVLRRGGAKTLTAEALLKPAGDDSGSTAREVPAPRLDDRPAGRWRPAYRRASQVSEEELLETLRAHCFELKPTAEALGIARGSLYDLIDRCSRVRKAADLRQGEIEEALQAADGDLAAAAAALEVSGQGLKRRLRSLGMR